MSAPKRRRILAFERIEQKASPCSLLLLVADADDGCLADQVQREGERDATASHWQHQFSTSELLRFIETNTSDAAHDLPAPMPTSTSSEAADEMMKLDDSDLRSMIVFAAMEVSAIGTTWD